MKIIINRDQVILKADPITLLAIVTSIEEFSKDKGFKVDIEHEMKDFSLIDQIRTITHTEDIDKFSSITHTKIDYSKETVESTKVYDVKHSQGISILNSIRSTIGSIYPEVVIDGNDANTDTNTSTANSTNPTR